MTPKYIPRLNFPGQAHILPSAILLGAAAYSKAFNILNQMLKFMEQYLFNMRVYVNRITH